MRGADIAYNPVFFSYLVLDLNHDSLHLYINANKVSHLSAYLEENNILSLPYEFITLDLEHWNS